MSRSTDPGHFFQTDASESTRARRAAKSSNKDGDPIVLPSKILNVVVDPFSSTSVYIAESAGCARRVDVEVGWWATGRVKNALLKRFPRQEIRRRSTEVQQHHLHRSQ
jgi:hypothetical protein